MIQQDLFGIVDHRLTHFEDCRAAIDQLYMEAYETQGYTAFDDFLNFAIRFSNLSVYNAMLVRVQRPGAVAVATRIKWETLHRYVKRDAIPIVLLRPFGPVSFVFEQGDTEGPSLPGEDASPLFATGPVDQKMYEQICRAAMKYGVNVLESDRFGMQLAGTADGINVRPETRRTSDGPEFLVQLNSKHTLATRFATLAHELGHIYCGHVGMDKNRHWPDRSKLDYVQVEMEAEAVSWLVCQRNGVHTKSREYLSALVGGVNPAGISIYTIFEAANRVESRTASVVRKQWIIADDTQRSAN